MTLHSLVITQYKDILVSQKNLMTWTFILDVLTSSPPPLKIYMDVFNYHTIENIFFLYNQRGKEKHSNMCHIYPIKFIRKAI
jgi:hypothetical protein